MSRGFDWPALLRVATAVHGMRPAEFWKLTPAELLLVLGLEGGGVPLGRDRLADLIAAFPDKVQGDEDDGC